MKRIWSFWSLGIVLLLIALLLTGCGKKNSPPTDPVIGEPQDFEISIKMPGEYEDVDYGSKHPIPSGKTVKFYFFQDIQDIDEDQPLNPILTITGTTRDKESRIFGTVPVGLNGKECYLFAVVVLKDDFGLEELEGKTQADIEADIEKALKNKSILFGQILDEQDPTDWKRYTLNPDLPPIEDFEFIGLAI